VGYGLIRRHVSHVLIGIGRRCSDVVRGGAYMTFERALRSAARRAYSPQFTVAYIGFRLKRVLVP
jgi:formylglycine-generating enzyme required for sulfatase activity